MKILFYLMFPNFPEGFFWGGKREEGGSHASHISPYRKRIMQMKMKMEHWWKDTDQGNPKYLEENFAQ
jgi:hypothetical protein